VHLLHLIWFFLFVSYLCSYILILLFYSLDNLFSFYIHPLYFRFGIYWITIHLFLFCITFPFLLFPYDFFITTRRLKYLVFNSYNYSSTVLHCYTLRFISFLNFLSSVLYFSLLFIYSFWLLFNFNIINYLKISCLYSFIELFSIQSIIEQFYIVSFNIFKSVLSISFSSSLLLLLASSNSLSSSKILNLLLIIIDFLSWFSWYLFFTSYYYFSHFI